MNLIYSSPGWLFDLKTEWSIRSLRCC